MKHRSIARFLLPGTVTLATLLGLAAILALPAPPAKGQTAQEQDPFAPPEPEWTIERFRWTGAVEGGTLVTVTNEFGDIRTRSSESAEIDVSAVIQKREDLEAEAEVSVVESEAGVLVEVRFPEASIDPGLLAPGRRPDRRVDLVVFLPTGAELDARTVRGLIEAKGLGGAARLRSERGDLVVRTTSSVDARTEHGSIAVVLRGLRWPSPPRLETLTGDIRLELPRSIDAVAHLSTRGEITTDYSIDIERDGLLRTGVATIGEGGQELFIDTNKGGVKLLETIE